MIDSKELMIGNWITLDWDGDKRPQKIALIGRDHFEVQDWDEQFSNFNLYPIPLTEDIFQKAGFTYDGSYWFIQPEMENVHYRLYELPFSNEWLLSRGFFKWDDQLKTIKFLHDLQNCLWILADLELTIQL